MGLFLKIGFLLVSFSFMGVVSGLTLVPTLGLWCGVPDEAIV